MAISILPETLMHFHYGNNPSSQKIEHKLKTDISILKIHIRLRHILLYVCHSVFDTNSAYISMWRRRLF